MKRLAFILLVSLPLNGFGLQSPSLYYRESIQAKLAEIAQMEKEAIIAEFTLFREESKPLYRRDRNVINNAKAKAKRLNNRQVEVYQEAINETIEIYQIGPWSSSRSESAHAADRGFKGTFHK